MACSIVDLLARSMPPVAPAKIYSIHPNHAYCPDVFDEMKCPTKDRIQALMKDANRPLSRLMCQRLIAKFPGVILSTDQH